MDFDNLSANHYLAASSNAGRQPRQRPWREKHQAEDSSSRSDTPDLRPVNDNKAFQLVRPGSFDDLHGPKVAYSSLAFAMLQEARDRDGEKASMVSVSATQEFPRDRYDQILDMFEGRDGAFHPVQPAAMQAYASAASHGSMQHEPQRGYAIALQLSTVI